MPHTQNISLYVNFGKSTKLKQESPGTNSRGKDGNYDKGLNILLKKTYKGTAANMETDAACGACDMLTAPRSHFSRATVELKTIKYKFIHNVLCLATRHVYHAFCCSLSIFEEKAKLHIYPPKVSDFAFTPLNFSFNMHIPTKIRTCNFHCVDIH